jgi:hypothetical protein
MLKGHSKCLPENRLKRLSQRCEERFTLIGDSAILGLGLLADYNLFFTH